MPSGKIGLKIVFPYIGLTTIFTFRTLTIVMRIPKYLLSLLVIVVMSYIAFDAMAQVDQQKLYGVWILVNQEQEKNINEPTSYDNRYEGKTIEEKLHIKKKEYLGKIKMEFTSKGICKIEQYGNTRKEKYEWDKDGLLKVGSRSYKVNLIDDQQLKMEDFGSALFNLTYYLIPEEDYNSKNEDELMAFTHYDSLVIKMVHDRTEMRNRDDIFHNPRFKAEFEGGWQAFEEFLKEEFGARFISSYDSRKAQVQISNLTFVVEPDGKVSYIGTEVSQTYIYEYFQTLFKELDGQWNPAEHDRINVPSTLRYVLKLKEL